MKTWLAAAVALFLGLAVILPGHGEDRGPTVLEKGLFSYQAPPGWTVTDSPMSKYKVGIGAPAKGFAPNINVVLENFAGPLTAYVAAAVATLKSSPAMSKVTLQEQKPFVTAAGLDGVRLVITDDIGKRQLQQVVYIFDVGSDQKLILTASCLRGDALREAPLFDASAKTLSLE